MTRTANARIAGLTFLVYIAAGILRVPDLRASVALALIPCFSALVLAVTLYAITRDEDPDLAMLAMTFRIGEGVIGAIFLSSRLALLSLETTGADAPDALGTHTLNAFLLGARGWNTVVGATFFAVGSTLFCWLLLRGRMIPAALAWLGVAASILLVVGLPLQLAGVIHGAATQLMFIPMAAFEIPLAFWLMIKGVAPPARTVDLDGSRL